MGRFRDGEFGRRLRGVRAVGDNFVGGLDVDSKFGCVEEKEQS
jgi:hypothetical protein